MSIFNGKAQEYDQWYETKRGKFIDDIETQLVFELLPPKKDWTVLDVGCGTGNYSLKLAKIVKEVIGIDISEDMLELAKIKAKKGKIYNVEFLKADVLKLPFKDNQFDAVYSITAIEFFEDLKRAFDEMYRVVKNKGKILLATINKDSLWGKYYMEKGKNGHPIFSKARFYNIEDLKKLKPETFLKYGEVLYIPPDWNDEEFNLENERKLKGEYKGGFIAALFDVFK